MDFVDLLCLLNQILGGSQTKHAVEYSMPDCLSAATASPWNFRIEK
jgi:hypothetical protein